MGLSRNLRIVSDGVRTSVLDADGCPVKWGSSGLVRIDIAPVTVDGFVSATLTLSNLALDLAAEVELRQLDVLPP